MQTWVGNKILDKYGNYILEEVESKAKLFFMLLFDGK